ncbi:unnamed protein product [Symbiodinium sp. KB8]|nr:unnamed protein product [Symbiodinium sp. KB8]
MKQFEGNDNPLAVAKDLREEISNFRANMLGSEPRHLMDLFEELKMDMDMEDGIALQMQVEAPCRLDHPPSLSPVIASAARLKRCSPVDDGWQCHWEMRKRKRCNQELEIRLEKVGAGLRVMGLPKDIEKGLCEDEPAVALDWDTANLQAMVDAINAAAVGVVPPPPWVAGAYPITPTQLQQAILARVQALAGGGGVVGRFVLAPNTMQQYGNIKAQLGYLGLDPLFTAHPAHVPIARAYVLADRRNATTAVADPIPVKTISLRFAQPKRKTRELECSQVSQASPSNQQQQQAADGSLVHLKVQTSRFDPHAAAACSEEVWASLTVCLSLAAGYYGVAGQLALQTTFQRELKEWDLVMLDFVYPKKGYVSWLKLYEDAVRAKSRKKATTGLEAGRGSPVSIPEPVPVVDGDSEIEFVPASIKSGRSKGLGIKPDPAGDDAMDESTHWAVKLCTEMVQKVVEGLRGEAFELARDIGIEAMTAPGGLKAFIQSLREIVFPRASEEARELFRAGQRPGALARQTGESMLSYISRRRRWWKLLKTLDPSIELSEPMRVELLLELSGLTRQEALVIKACRSGPSFEATGATLVEHYTGVHLKEGRALGAATSRIGAGKGGKFGTPKGRGKYKPFTKKAYPAIAEEDDYLEDYPQEEPQEWEETSYPAWEDDDSGQAEPLELDPDLAEAGHAIQLELAAHAAFGDPECKFPTQKGGKGKGTANLAIMESDSGSSDEGIHVPSGNDSRMSAHVVTEPGTTAKVWPRPTPKAASSSGYAEAVPRAMEMAVGDRKFTIGVYKRRTYASVAQELQFIAWALAQSEPSAGLRDFLTWFNRYYVLRDGAVESKASLGIPEGTYVPRPKAKGGAKKRPNPPLPQACAAGCTSFTYQGSTATTVRKTCRDCGHSTTERRQQNYTQDPETCSHEFVDNRGSSRTTSRTFCRLCGTFVDEVPQTFHAQRKAMARRMLQATADAVNTTAAITADDATADLEPHMVEVILGTFQDRVSHAMARGDSMSAAGLHEHLRAAITEVMDEPTSPSSPPWELTAMMAWNGGWNGVYDGNASSGDDESAVQQRIAESCDPDPVVRPIPPGLVDRGRLPEFIANARRNPEQAPGQWDVPVDPYGNDSVVGTFWHDQCYSWDWDPHDPFGDLTPEERSAADPPVDQFDDWVAEQTRGMIEQGLGPVGQAAPLPLSIMDEQHMGDPVCRGIGYAPVPKARPDRTAPASSSSSAPQRALSDDEGIRGDIVPIGNIPMVNLWDPSDPHLYGTQPCVTNGLEYEEGRTHLERAWEKIVILTAGSNFNFPNRDRRGIKNPQSWTRSVPMSICNDDTAWTWHAVDCRRIESDPEHGNFRAHVGRHPGIITQVLSDAEGRRLVNEAAAVLHRYVCQTEQQPVLYICYCNQNRHRSVAVGTLISAMLFSADIKHDLVHAHAAQSWPRMTCGGRCGLCGLRFTETVATELGHRVRAHLNVYNSLCRQPTEPVPTCDPCWHTPGPAPAASTPGQVGKGQGFNPPPRASGPQFQRLNLASGESAYVPQRGGIIAPRPDPIVAPAPPLPSSRRRPTSINLREGPGARRPDGDGDGDGGDGGDDPGDGDPGDGGNVDPGDSIAEARLSEVRGQLDWAMNELERKLGPRATSQERTDAAAEAEGEIPDFGDDEYIRDDLIARGRPLAHLGKGRGTGLDAYGTMTRTRCSERLTSEQEDEPFDAVVDDDDVARLDPGKGKCKDKGKGKDKGKKGKMSSATKAAKGIVPVVEIYVGLPVAISWVPRHGQRGGGYTRRSPIGCSTLPVPDPLTESVVAVAFAQEIFEGGQLTMGPRNDFSTKADIYMRQFAKLAGSRLTPKVKPKPPRKRLANAKLVPKATVKPPTAPQEPAPAHQKLEDEHKAAQEASAIFRSDRCNRSAGRRAKTLRFGRCSLRSQSILLIAMKYSAISINLATVRLDLQISRPTLYRFALWLAAGNVLTRPAGSVGLLFPLLLQHMEPRASLCILSLWLKCCLCRPAAMAKRGASTVVEGFASRAIVPVRRDDFGGGLELWVPSEQQHRWDKKHSGKRLYLSSAAVGIDTEVTGMLVRRPMLTSKASLETGKVQGDAKKSVARLYDVLDSGSEVKPDRVKEARPRARRSSRPVMKHENMDDQQQASIDPEESGHLSSILRVAAAREAEKCLAFQNSGKMWLPCWASPVVSLAAPEDEGHEENPAAVCVHRLSVVQFSRDMFPGGICGSAGQQEKARGPQPAEMKIAQASKGQARNLAHQRSEDISGGSLGEAGGKFQAEEGILMTRRASRRTWSRHSCSWLSGNFIGASH